MYTNPHPKPNPQVAALVRQIEAVPCCTVCRTPRNHDCGGDCNPDDDCACCLGECDCPPVRGWWWCAHLDARAARVDLDVYRRLLWAADPVTYSGRPAPADGLLPARGYSCVTAGGVAFDARVERMAARAGRQESLWDGARLDAAACDRLARALGTLRNGAVTVGAIGTEREVRCG